MKNQTSRFAPCNRKAIKKKIIFLIPTLSIGGGERVVSELSLNLPNYIKTTFVLFKNEISYPYKGNLICLNLPISNNVFLKTYSFFSALFQLKKIIRKEKADYVISFGNQPNIINILTGGRSLVRVDIFISLLSNDFWGKIYKILVKLFFNKSFQVISVSKAVADDLIKNFGVKKEKIKLIYNPLNIKKIQQLTTEPLENKYKEVFKNPVVINTGRLTKQKSQWHLIRAFKNVKDKIKEAKLVILGKGELETQLKKLIKELNLENDVYFLGWQQNPFKFLAKSRAFVLSSLYEGLPGVILEAMACGLPIISADCKSGPREILAPDTDINHQAQDIEYAENGILTPAFDERFYRAEEPLTRSEKKLSEAMIEILTNKELSDNLIKKSKQRADDFDIKKIIKKWDFLGY